ncbi:hypothetical protein L1987_83786 [Smallanthus sonchifolius]|uniref:Uncharacterized protein n=1 Tax=Smallanthus sonchifolius TaxID=185202 RepID=A0ACB8YDJ2_9ASTR|nr:hypothetical protein L1987_83786 [Smallanthus sonchifolius]
MVAIKSCNEDGLQPLDFAIGFDTFNSQLSLRFSSLTFHRAATIATVRAHCITYVERSIVQVYAPFNFYSSTVTQMSSLYHDPAPTLRTQSTCQQGEIAWNNVTDGLSMDVDKQQTLLEGDIEKMEIPAQAELNLCEADNIQEPCQGMLFESDEAARTFYDDYAGRVGFVTRVLSSRKSERDGTIISRGLGCRGDLENHKNESIMIKKKNKGQENCAAMILVKREKPGNWVIRKFIKEHNHPLRVSISKRRLPFDEKDKRIQELSAELRVKKRLTAAYREQLLAIMKDVDGHNEHLSSKVEIVHNNLKKLEANILQI